MTLAERQAIIERAERTGRLDATAASNLRKWMSGEPYASQRPAIEELIRREAFEELQDAFGAVIPFGTGGRRGAMGPGPNRINERTIGESAEGLCRHVLASIQEGAGGEGRRSVETVGGTGERGPGAADPSSRSPAAVDVEAGRQADGAAARGAARGAPIVIAYDTRRNSRAFAEVAASVVAANGIEALLFEGPRATPELSYAVRHLRASAGIVISASHNPPGDNGFKAYWSDGGQVVPPHDAAIIEQVVRASDFSRLDLGVAATRGLFRVIGDDVDRAYIDYTTSLSLGSDREIRIVYTPLHGTGVTSVARILSAAGFEDVHPVESQWEPDPDFGGVPGRSPNPENPAALEAGVREARSLGADLVLASDPDADRLGAVVRHGGEWRFLTGNQIGCLLFDHVTERLAARGALGGGVLMKTCVTTDLLDRIAESRGVSVRGDFLVGFKYIGEELMGMGDTSRFVFGTEESHGYLRGPEVRDKDAAQAAVLLAEHAAALKKRGRTLVDGLAEIWTRHGYHADITRSIALQGTGGGVLAKKMMESLRVRPPQEIAGERIVAIADRKTGKITDPVTGREVGETRGIKGDLLVLHLVEGGAERISIRPSGTEPKVKIYIQIRASGKGPLDQEKARTDERAERLAAAAQEMLGRP